MAKVEIKSLYKIFGPRPETVLAELKGAKAFDKNEILKRTGHTVAICDANLSVEEGQVSVIIGMSGSGKSTLIRCLDLLNRPTSGEVIIDGEDICKYNKTQLTKLRREKVSMVFQNFGLMTHKNVIENVAFGLEIQDIPKLARHEKAEEMIRLVGLSGYENASVSALSGGMKQRVGLARALAVESPILLMDEPFSALDPIVRRDMQLELLGIQKSIKKTIIFITHDINEAFKIGDHIAIMKDALMVQKGRPEEIMKAPANDFVSDFIMDIDRSKVITAKNIMSFPGALVFESAGPHWAIKEMKANGINSVFVMSSGMRLIGLLTLEGAIEAINTQKTLKEAVITDIQTTRPDTSVHELLQSVKAAKYPIAVTDDDNSFLGLVTRASVMAALVE